MILLRDAIVGQTYTVTRRWKGAIVKINHNGDAVLVKQDYRGFPSRGYLDNVAWTKEAYGNTLQLEVYKEDINVLLMKDAPTGLYEIYGYLGEPFCSDNWKGALIFKTSKGGYLVKQSVKNMPDDILLNKMCFRMDWYGDKIQLIPHKL
jgi:hypothetical protein